MNCLIIDEDKRERDAVKDLAAQVEDLNLVAECSNTVEAIDFINSKPVDLVFIDLKTPELSELEITRKLKNRKPIIIFLSERKDYAAEAFGLNVADYIVKPVTPSRFQQALNLAREIYNSNRLNSMPEKEFVFIRDSGMLKRLTIDEIQFLEAMGDYVKIFTQQKFYAIHTTLRKVEEMLPTKRFQRVHRSYIVALNKIEKIQEGVIVINQKAVPVADIYRSTLYKRLNII